jgi:hypothetical protein
VTWREEPIEWCRHPSSTALRCTVPASVQGYTLVGEANGKSWPCSSPGGCHGSLSAKWRVAGCSAGDCSKRCTPCGWLVLTKIAPCRVITAQAVMTWQMMTRGLAQAGNRTSKTALCSQWWDCKPEWNVDASGAGNQCDCQPFFLVAVPASLFPNPLSKQPKCLGGCSLLLRLDSTAKWPC